MTRRRAIVLLLLSLYLLSPGVTLAEKPELGSRVELSSPVSGTEVGGVVSILGSVLLDGLQGYTVSFGAGEEFIQWIQIGEMREEGMLDGRLALWDTTEIPDGVYTLRLRALCGDDRYEYVDFFVDQILVSNAPRTPSPVPTPPPTSTPTETPLPTLTPTRAATLALDDGVSPYLYVTLMDQYDPLCMNWPQRYSIWVSNVGMVTVTNVLVTDTLALGCQPILSQSTGGAVYDGEETIHWALGTMRPGEARKIDLKVSIPTWLESGKWLANKVTVSCDQVPLVSKSERSLLSDCVWRKETAAARPFIFPTSEPLPTPSQTPTRSALSALKPTLLATSTPITFSVPGETVEASLDLLTLIISVALGILVVLTAVLVYRRVFRRA